MKRVKISAVSYANTYPFLYGIDKKLDSNTYELSLDVPSECARKLQHNEVDLGLIPVAMIPQIENAEIISDYCIGADGAVKTVLLMSMIPLEEIKTVYLDTDSRSSAQLLKILALEYWKADWDYKELPNDFATNKKIESILLIGDKTQKPLPYTYIYDLAEVWKDFTGKPFVFAAWVANKKLDSSFIEEFNKAISFGLENISKSIKEYNVSHNYDLEEYLTKYISYNFNEDKKNALKQYLGFIK